MNRRKSPLRRRAAPNGTSGLSGPVGRLELARSVSVAPASSSRLPVDVGDAATIRGRCAADSANRARVPFGTGASQRAPGGLSSGRPLGSGRVDGAGIPRLRASLPGPASRASSPRQASALRRSHTRRRGDPDPDGIFWRVPTHLTGDGIEGEPDRAKKVRRAPDGVECSVGYTLVVSA